MPAATNTKTKNDRHFNFSNCALANGDIDSMPTLAITFNVLLQPTVIVRVGKPNRKFL